MFYFSNAKFSLLVFRGPEVESSCGPRTTTVTSYNNNTLWRNKSVRVTCTYKQHLLHIRMSTSLLHSCLSVLRLAYNLPVIKYFTYFTRCFICCWLKLSNKYEYKNKIVQSCSSLRKKRYLVGMQTIFSIMILYRKLKTQP